MLSLDGYIEGSNGDISWHVWNEEMSDYMMDFFKTVDTFIYGRKAYELMLTYWPFETGDFAEIMNNTPKIVFSRTLNDVKWNSRLIKQNVIEEIRLEKGKAGKDLVLFAGANIASTFMANGLIDEFRLIVNPVVLGEGTSLFQVRNQMELELQESRTFACGNTLLHYRLKNRNLI